MNWAILTGIVLFLAAAAALECGPWHYANDDTFALHIDDVDSHVAIEGRGVIDLAPDASGVTALGADGYLDLGSDVGGIARRVRFSNSNGTIARQFWVGREERRWGADADSLVAELMPIVLRETAIDVEARVA